MPKQQKKAAIDWSDRENENERTKICNMKGFAVTLVVDQSIHFFKGKISHVSPSAVVTITT